MNRVKTHKCRYHKKQQEFYVLSEIRQWIIDFWSSFIKRLKNVLSERRLSRIRSLHTKLDGNVSANLNENSKIKKYVRQECPLHKHGKRRVKGKNIQKEIKKCEKKKSEIFQELSDDYSALYEKRSDEVNVKKIDSKLIDKKISDRSLDSFIRRAKRYSQLNIVDQEETQNCIEDEIIDTNNNNKKDLINIKDLQCKPSRIPRLQRRRLIKSKSRISYTKLHKNYIRKN